ncbi:MAG TPA: hypothetical protein PKK06_15680 [Phycisphaerae bacterium]|nr:hypothetical protein [Phycisphaerae bacterium]HNU46760.1 hypothetical protein [Phycisphaerae bacterium]
MCTIAIVTVAISWLAVSPQEARSPLQDQPTLEAARGYVLSQPRSFENEVFFHLVDGEVVRSDYFQGEPGRTYGDFDSDGDVDLVDYTVFQICYEVSGPGVPTVPGCLVFDGNEDGVVDLVDTAEFTRAFTGSLSAVLVEAGGLFPIAGDPEGYYSGWPGEPGNNALNGHAAQAGYTQDDFWYEWSVVSQPPGSGQLLFSNQSLPATAYAILAPAAQGEYLFLLTVTNLITGQTGTDTVVLPVYECVWDEDCPAGAVCEDYECVVPVFQFTLGLDDLTGTDADDTFEAPLIWDPGAGALMPSFQTGDAAEGGAGTDSLYATLAYGANPVVMSTSIENLYFTNYAAEWIDASSISGAELIGWVGGIANLTVDALPNKVDGLIAGVNSAGITFELSFESGSGSPTTGSADGLSLEVSDTTTGTFQVTTAANGFEILTVDSTGEHANTLTAITQTTGTTMVTASFTGDTDLSIGTIPDTVLTIVATSMAGGLQLGTGTTAATYAGFAAAANHLIDLDTGPGDDKIIFGTQFDGNDFAGATVDLRGGTDTVQATFASDYGTPMPFRNVEVFRCNATVPLTVNFAGITGLASLTIEADGAATAITLQNIPPTAAVFPQLVFRGDNTQAAQTYDTVTYQATGVTGSADSLAIDVNNRGTPLNAGLGTTNVHTIGAITAPGFETVTVDIADGPATFGGITASTMTSFDIDTGANVPSAGTITLGTVAPTTATLVSVDASGVGCNLSATFDYLASGASITTASGNDTITAGANSTATTLSVSLGAGNDTFTGDTNTDCADSVNAGAGNDTIDAYGGSDTITTGDGADTVVYRRRTTGNREDISDFTTGGGGDVMRFDQSDLGLTGVTEYVGPIAGVGNQYIVVITGGAGYASEAVAEAAVNAVGTLGDGVNLIIIYWDTTASMTKILWDTDANTDDGLGASLVLIGKLTNITTLTTHNTLTAANVDSQG